MTEERKKRYYPKRGEHIPSKDKVTFEPVSKGRKEIDDSRWTNEAIEGIKAGIFKSPNEAALKIAVRIGGSDYVINKNQKRIARKTQKLRRSDPSQLHN